MEIRSYGPVVRPSCWSSTSALGYLATVRRAAARIAGSRPQHGQAEGGPRNHDESEPAPSDPVDHRQPDTHHHQIGHPERDTDLQRRGLGETVLSQNRRRVIDDHLDTAELSERGHATAHQQSRPHPRLPDQPAPTPVRTGAALLFLDMDDAFQLLRHINAVRADALQDLPRSVVVVAADEPARALRQLEHQQQHQRGRHDRQTDRDPPGKELARPHDGGHDDTDPDPDLEGEHQLAAPTRRGQLGNVHRHRLGCATHREAEHDPGQGKSPRVRGERGRQRPAEEMPATNISVFFRPIRSDSRLQDRPRRWPPAECSPR